MSMRSKSQQLAIYFVDLETAAAVLNVAEMRTPRLSPDQIQRHRQKASIDLTEADHWRRTHIALRIALERFAGSGVRGIAFDIAPGGRPCLPANADLIKRPHFSLAHAGQYALIAISNAGRIGIDLEVTRTLNVTTERRHRIEAAARYLAPDANLPETPDARFLQAWVRLEAVAKASGLGIGRILTEAGVIGGASHTLSPASSTVRDLSLPSGCYAAIAGDELPAILTVEDFPTDKAGIAGFLH